ncbi:MAG: DUF839 domain-containing protein [Cyanobacteria bacterium REEB417]|nr:DUF839 domain-containing protein [Cyanobacteria bacterium REEB417]
MQRRTLLLQLLGVGASATAAPALALINRHGVTGASGPASAASPAAASTVASLPFRPLIGPLPLPGDGLSAAEQQRTYTRVALRDALLVPDGYQVELLLQWGDRLGSGRFGFNNDYLAFTPLEGNRSLLTVNFEYISPRLWVEGYREAMGRDLPFEPLRLGLARLGGSVDSGALAPEDPLREPLLAVARAAMEDLGIGVAEIERDPSGRWRPRAGRLDRRISGISGLSDPDQRLHCSGPASAVFRRRQRLGYDDRLGDRIIGSFANCAGGQTPWGTVLSAEENFQSQVVEAVFADGSSPPPAQRPFRFDGERLDGLGNPFGLCGNKYGWMVEINPRRPQEPAVKHTALGRFRHEAVAVRARAGEPLVVYSGCDRRGGHLYRYESRGRVTDPTDRRNSDLLTDGTLAGAVFHPDGTGEWRPLRPDTPVAPLAGPVLLPHSDRRRGGVERLEQAEAIAAYARRFPTLGDLYEGSDDQETLGALLIDVHYAANAAGITGTARPEDTELDPRSGDLLVAFTSGLASEEGIPDPRIFRGPRGRTPWNEGWIMRLSETGPGRFRWRMVATGGAPADGGLGFANPDNLALDPGGEALWMVSDIGTGELNGDRNGGAFGNNTCWVIPLAGPGAGQAHCFASGPMECELTGPEFSVDGRSLFLAVQHPGEAHGRRRAMAREGRAFSVTTGDGRPLEQLRWVPLGSNWPSGAADADPRPGVVVIRRDDGRPLLAPFS